METTLPKITVTAPQRVNDYFFIELDYGDGGQEDRTDFIQIHTSFEIGSDEFNERIADMWGMTPEVASYVCDYMVREHADWRDKPPSWIRRHRDMLGNLIPIIGIAFSLYMAWRY